MKFDIDGFKGIWAVLVLLVLLYIAYHVGQTGRLVG